MPLRMDPSRCALALAFAALPACTPLGWWMYEDPNVTVPGVVVGSVDVPDSALSLVVKIDNRNDFDIAIEETTLSFHVDGVRLGVTSQDTVVAVSRLNATEVVFRLAIAGNQAANRVRSLQPGPLRYAVRGRLKLATPIGARYIAVSEEGTGSYQENPIQKKPATPGQGPFGVGSRHAVR